MRALLVLALLLLSCGSLSTATPSPSAARTSAPSATASASGPGRSLSASDAQKLVGARVAATLDALKRKDGSALAALAHPTKGVRFTPYPFVSVAKDAKDLQWPEAGRQPQHRFERGVDAFATERLEPGDQGFHGARLRSVACGAEIS